MKKETSYSTKKVKNYVHMISKILPNISIGDLFDGQTVDAKEYDAILNVCEETYTPPTGIVYAHIPIAEKTQDFGRSRHPFFMALKTLRRWVEKEKYRVLVHCLMGQNRSTSVVVAYLLTLGMPFSSAYGLVRSKRPFAKIYPDMMQILEQFQKVIKKKAEKNTSPEQFLQAIDWSKSFEENYVHIVSDTKPIVEHNLYETLVQPSTPEKEESDSARFIRADILISRALGLEHYRAQQFPEGEKGTAVDIYAKKEDMPTQDIIPPTPLEAYTKVLSLRGLMLPAPHVFHGPRYQNAYTRAPLIPLDWTKPNSIDAAIDFIKKTPGVKIGTTEFWRCTTEFGSLQNNHIAYASWFALFSPNTAVQVEETQFVLWQAGKHSEEKHNFSGLISRKPAIQYWLQFLKWAGFPDFHRLKDVIGTLDPSDEAYANRLLTLTRLPGIQFKVASFLLALLGDTRSPTIDMHAMGYLLDTGKIAPPGKSQWYPLADLKKEGEELAVLFRQSKKNPALKFEYEQKKQQYDEKCLTNYKTLSAVRKRTEITQTDNPTEKALATQRERVKKYIEMQLKGWDGKTDTFWAWYASNPWFKSHEPYPDMIHTVFFQSLFPELFTTEALAQRDWAQKTIQYLNTKPEYEWTKEDKELAQRVKYRNYIENLEEMRKIQKPPQEYEISTPMEYTPSEPSETRLDTTQQTKENIDVATN